MHITISKAKIPLRFLPSYLVFLQSPAYLGGIITIFINLNYFIFMSWFDSGENDDDENNNSNNNNDNKIMNRIYSYS